jgi:hypothetical protein
MCREYLVRVSLVGFGCLVALALGEGFVRWFHPESRDHVFPSLLEIDPNLGWRLRAGESAPHESSYFAVTYSINELGYRDRPRGIPKPEGVHRILLYGDSQIFGWGIQADQRFSNLIEDRLPSLEIWNLAVIGYGLDQEILSYEDKGQLLNADQVILFASRDTLNRTYVDYFSKKHKPRFVMEQNGTLRVIPIPPGAHARTRFLYDVFGFLYLPHFLERRQMILDDIRQRAAGAQGSETLEGAVPIGEFEKSLFEKARQIALERRHRLTILASLPGAATKELQSFGERQGIGVIAIGLPEDPVELRLGRYDRHWNVRAHQLIVGQLLPYFLETRPAASAASGPKDTERR